ncbi:glycosyltransferase [Algoriphagus formosus]|uniref:glycosyltransferase n=1 Tax=Algoriphagus formosus TaxID=2007308 RepID=UPI003F6F5DF2
MDFGGVEQRVRLTAQAFVKVPNVRIIIVVLSQSGRIAEELLSEGHHVIFLNSSVRIPNLLIIQKLASFFRDQAPDVVHTSGAEANFHALIAAKIAGVPVRIGEEIGFPNHDWKWRLIFKGIYALATKVIAISQAVKNRIVEVGEVGEKKVELVYNPVSLHGIGNRNPDRYREGIGNEKEFVFVTTCRLVKIKNLESLIQVFAALVKDNSDQDIKLWIIGEGPEKESLESLAKDLGVSDQVVFWGFQSDVSSFLVQADAFVLPSYSEGFSISLVEAMLCGLPCIATNQGGPTEILEDGLTGFLIDPLNNLEIQQAMQQIMNLPNQERQAMGQRAEEEAKRFSLENYIGKLMKIYSNTKFRIQYS